jgi:hypothetical protein
MKLARLRLILAAILFVGWLGWLGYLALEYRKPVIVSRSQLLVATSVIKAEIALDAKGKPSPTVRVIESFDRQRIPDETITIENISDARLPDGKTPATGGPYLLLLEQMPERRYKVAGAAGGSGVNSGQLFIIYPWSSEVERQIH